jgi:choice-of-anchor B domain-containing protein
MNKLFTLVTILFSFNLMGQTPCENGVVSGYPCNQVDLYAHLNNQDLSGTTGVQGSDIWGWTDPQTNKEYVLMGQTNGVVFVDISNPSSPNIIGRLPSHTGNSSAWRDIKVYNNHAFIVAENNSGHGMQVFNLARLRNTGNSIEVFDNDGHYDGVSSAHNIVINEATGFAYIVGARNAGNGCGVGGLHIVNIQDPKNPIYAGCFDADGYTHDAQCVIYNGPDLDYQGMEICFNANENTVTIANVDDKNSTSLIAKSGYSQSAYSHQGWLTEDHQYFISNDELDEGNFGFNTRTLIWDVRDLDNPVLMNQHYGEKSSIDHNLYIKDNRIYQSNYTSGLIILDANRINKGEIRERAFFDTYPSSNSSTFNGSWSNYPFFESGVVAISDINSGLFLVQPAIENLIESHPVFESCDNDNTLLVELTSVESIEAFQWQVVLDGPAEDLQNNNDFSGVDTEELIIDPNLEGLEEMRFRCKVTFENGSVAYTYLSNTTSGFPSTSFNAELNNLEVSFMNNTTAGDSYEWNFGDGSEISTDENPIHLYEEVGTYDVTLTATNTCGAESYSYTVNLSPCIPNADFTFEAIEDEINFFTSSNPANEFEWDFGDGSLISNEVNPIHQFEEAGTFTVTLVVRNECGESTYSETLDIEEILSNDLKEVPEFNVFPNPFDNVINIKSFNSTHLQNLRVIDQNGRELINMQNFDNASKLSFNTNFWSQGMYFIIFTNQDGSKEVKKLVKQ